MGYLYIVRISKNVSGVFIMFKEGTLMGKSMRQVLSFLGLKFSWEKIYKSETTEKLNNNITA